MEKRALVVVDGQNDFLDPRGSLCIPNALKEARHLSKRVQQFPEAFDRIYFTKDSHYDHDIAHAEFWRNLQGPQIHPKAFSVISASDVKQKCWVPTKENSERGLSYIIHYLETIESKGIQHTIWPNHCVMGTWGHNLHPILRQMWKVWAESFEVRPYYSVVTKGENPLTEQYSAVEAIIPNSDERTQRKQSWLDELSEYDEIFWCGWAGSHCLASTMKDAIPELSVQHYIFRDIAAPVKGYEKERSNCFTELKKRPNVTVTYLDTYMEQWRHP